MMTTSPILQQKHGAGVSSDDDEYFEFEPLDDDLSTMPAHPGERAYMLAGDCAVDSSSCSEDGRRGSFQRSVVELTRNSVSEALLGNKVANPVMQVIALSKIQGMCEASDRYLACLSDGVNFCQSCPIAGRLNSRMKEGALQENSIVLLKWYMVDKESELKKRVIFIADFDVVYQDYPTVIGHPKLWSTQQEQDEEEVENEGVEEESLLNPVKGAPRRKHTEPDTTENPGAPDAGDLSSWRDIALKNFIEHEQKHGRPIRPPNEDGQQISDSDTDSTASKKRRRERDPNEPHATDLLCEFKRTDNGGTVTFRTRYVEAWKLAFMKHVHRPTLLTTDRRYLVKSPLSPVTVSIYFHGTCAIQGKDADLWIHKSFKHLKPMVLRYSRKTSPIPDRRCDEDERDMLEIRQHADMAMQDSGFQEAATPKEGFLSWSDCVKARIKGQSASADASSVASTSSFGSTSSPGCQRSNLGRNTRQVYEPPHRRQVGPLRPQYNNRQSPQMTQSLQSNEGLRDRNDNVYQRRRLDSASSGSSIQHWRSNTPQFSPTDSSPRNQGNQGQRFNYANNNRFQPLQQLDNGNGFTTVTRNRNRDNTGANQSPPNRRGPRMADDRLGIYNPTEFRGGRGLRIWIDDPPVWAAAFALLPCARPDVRDLQTRALVHFPGEGTVCIYDDGRVIVHNARNSRQFLLSRWDQLMAEIEYVRQREVENVHNQGMGMQHEGAPAPSPAPSLGKPMEQCVNAPEFIPASVKAITTPVAPAKPDISLPPIRCINNKSECRFFVKDLELWKQAFLTLDNSSFIERQGGFRFIEIGTDVSISMQGDGAITVYHGQNAADWIRQVFPLMRAKLGEVNAEAEVCQKANEESMEDVQNENSVTPTPSQQPHQGRRVISHISEDKEVYIYGDYKPKAVNMRYVMPIHHPYGPAFMSTAADPTAMLAQQRPRFAMPASQAGLKIDAVGQRVAPKTQNVFGPPPGLPPPWSTTADGQLSPRSCSSNLVQNPWTTSFENVAQAAGIAVKSLNQSSENAAMTHHDYDLD